MPDETRKERRAPQVLATLAGVLAAFLLAAACYVGWQAVHILFPQNVYETALPAVVSPPILGPSSVCGVGRHRRRRRAAV